MLKSSPLYATIFIEMIKETFVANCQEMITQSPTCAVAQVLRTSLEVFIGSLHQMDPRDP